MAAIAGLVILFGIVNVIYPIESLGIARRSWGVMIVLVGFALSAAASSSDPKVASASSSSSSRSSGFSSSSTCGTDAFGRYKCDSEANFGSHTSKMVCRQNKVTNATTCNMETN